MLRFNIVCFRLTVHWLFSVYLFTFFIPFGFLGGFLDAFKNKNDFDDKKSSYFLNSSTLLPKDVKTKRLYIYFF